MTTPLRHALAVTTAAALIAGLAACASSGGTTGSSTSSIVSGTSSGSGTGSGSPSVATTVTAPATPTPSTSAAAGSITSTDKSFSVVAPTGWKPLKLATATFAIKAPAPQDTVTTNFNVVVQSPQPAPALDDVVSQAEISWRQQGLTVTDEPDRTVGGLPSRGYTLTRTAQGTKFTQTQFFIVYRNHVYSLTMTSAATPAASSGAGQALNAILSTWAWK